MFAMLSARNRSSHSNPFSASNVGAAGQQKTVDVGIAHDASPIDAAIALDRELLRLSGMEARCRIVQAELARTLLDRRAWRPLGFVRLSDYARERMGISSRSLEDDALVLRALDALPQLRAAMHAAAIGWTRLRLLVRVATPENERQLLEAALTMTTRELEDALRKFKCTGDATSIRVEHPEAAGTVTSPPSSDAANADSPLPLREEHLTDSEEDPEIRWGILLSRTGRRMWRAACEFASRTAGSPLGPPRVLELVTAEAVSGAEDAALAAAPPADGHERRFRDRMQADHARGTRTILAFLAKTGVTEGFDWLTPASHDCAPVERLGRLVAGQKHADAFELDSRLRECRCIMQRIDAQMAALLRAGIDGRLFGHLGFATLKLYVETRLGLSARKAWSLVAVERAARRACPPLRDAWREGRISHLAACTLLPVIGEEHGDAWIQRACEVTLRRLVDEVAWALDQLDRGDGSAAVRRPGPPPSHDAVVRIEGLGDIGQDEVQMRAHGHGAEGWPASVNVVRMEYAVPLSIAVLAEAALVQLRIGNEPRGRTFERMVALALLEWTSMPRHRDPVFERDGWRCSVPGCSSRRNLQDHHVMFRSHGGGNARDNRTTVCAAHHLHGLHGGIIRARGRAPSRIVWELGCRRDGRPLMRTLGDRFV